MQLFVLGCGVVGAKEPRLPALNPMHPMGHTHGYYHAFGLLHSLPVFMDSPSLGHRSCRTTAAPCWQQAIRSRNDAKRVMQELTTKYDVDESVLRIAAQRGTNVAFTHWRARLLLRNPQVGLHTVLAVTT